MSMPKVLSSVNPMQKAINKTPTCIICLGEDKPLEKFQGSCKCRPDVHIKCIDEWLTKNGRTCPICRQKYPENDDQKKENEENRTRDEKEHETCVAWCLFCYICCLPLVSAV